MGSNNYFSYLEKKKSAVIKLLYYITDLKLIYFSFVCLNVYLYLQKIHVIFFLVVSALSSLAGTTTGLF